MNQEHKLTFKSCFHEPKFNELIFIGDQDDYTLIAGFNTENKEIINFIVVAINEKLKRDATAAIDKVLEGEGKEYCKCDHPKSDTLGFGSPFCLICNKLMRF